MGAIETLTGLRRFEVKAKRRVLIGPEVTTTELELRANNITKEPFTLRFNSSLDARMVYSDERTSGIQNGYGFVAAGGFILGTAISFAQVKSYGMAVSTALLGLGLIRAGLPGVNHAIKGRLALRELDKLYNLRNQRNPNKPE